MSSRKRFREECREWRRRFDPLNGLDCANLVPPRGGTGTGSGYSGEGGSVPGSPPTSFFGSGGTAGDLSPQSGAGTAGIGNMLPWLYPTADFRNVDKFGAVALPATNNWADILVFNVEPGRCLKITQLGIDFVANGGTAYVQGTATPQLKFFLGVDGSPAIPGRPGKPFPDYSPPNFLFLPGAVSAPTPINGLMVRERQEVHVAVFNVSIGPSTQSLAARVIAYSFSKKYWSKLMGPQ